MADEAQQSDAGQREYEIAIAWQYDRRVASEHPIHPRHALYGLPKGALREREVRIGHRAPFRRFSVLLEDTRPVEKWFRPSSGILRIFYRYGRGDQEYLPDFVVETAHEKLVCEIKSANEMDHPEVEANAKAAVAWCERATKHEQSIGGKAWRYTLIPRDAVNANSTLKALVERYSLTANFVAV
ncbi:MAG TPA: hypothetical protein VNA69_12560 [Thermoanaerobaculia bacterium]|nr:hypothetical protein [Thermoanaerobaculia bacterium]